MNVQFIGYVLARSRFGEDVHFVTNEICQIENRKENDNLIELIVVSIVITNEWIVACRETTLDQWAIPISICEIVNDNEEDVEDKFENGKNPQIQIEGEEKNDKQQHGQHNNHHRIIFKACGVEYICNCRNKESFIMLNDALEFAVNLREGKISSNECFIEIIRQKALTNPHHG